MRLAASLAVLPLALAAPQLSGQGSNTTTSSSANSTAMPLRFSIMSIASGSDIQYATLNASSSALWIAHKTSTSCPQNALCPQNPGTVFKPSSNGGIELDVKVPGGQEVYVATDGRVKFSKAQKSGSRSLRKTNGRVRLPPGPILPGHNATEKADGKWELQRSDLTYDGKDFFACDEEGDTGMAVYAASRKNTTDGCTQFKMYATPSKAEGAYEYV